MRNLVACLALCLCLGVRASAVIVNFTGSGADLSLQGNPAGFTSVGIRGSGSAVYLGNGWVLTAAHVGAGTTWFNDTAYDVVSGSAVQLTNPTGAGYTALSDLLLYQIQGRPNLPTLIIDSKTPQTGWQVTMVGNGRDVRSTSQAFWTSSWGTASSPSPYAGYIWASNNVIRWGTNIIDAVNLPQGIGGASDEAFVTTFNSGGLPYEAQGSPGDSGGGVFRTDTTTGRTYLAGLMFSISGYPTQPWGISVFGNTTYSAELSVYRNAIYSVIGVPGDVNFDGVVNGLDISLIVSNWLTKGSGAASPNGDANHDGLVNGLDISLVLSNWPGGQGAGFGDGTASASAVPEPATLMSAVLAALVLVSAATLRRVWRYAAIG